ncbi:MAG: TIGR03986 family CRISPR-associated RAMP protein [bacterium]|nr:TIGR03986 family CRISPR-associated RAMP protein [bacterium]
MGKKERKDFKDQLNEIGKENFGMEIDENETPEVQSNSALENFYMDQIPHIEDEARRAKAPYNFVPLNKTVVTSDFKIADVPFDKYHTKRNTGYIDLNICTLTSMYIRDNKNKDDDERIINPDFFSPANGKARIPGSSIRGLLRNMVEVVSYGKFENFDDKRLYMRGFADRTLGDVYRSYGMSTRVRGIVSYSMNCGLLIKRGNEYKIQDSGRATQITKADTVTRIGHRGNEFEFYDFGSEYIVVPGRMSRDRNWIVPKPPAGCIEHPLLKEDIDDYRNDENRTDNVNLLEKVKRLATGVPCFYIQWQDENGETRTTFGHTGMFRLPYRKTIGEHIPDFLKFKELDDFAEAIFGNEKTFSGRVFFEDSFNDKEDKSEILIGETHPKILSGPKPTTFQHYLTQNSAEANELKHYDPVNSKLSAIRGNKLYWHKENADNWKEHESVPINNNIHTKINPVRKDTIFKGRIRFENLSDEELGAILFALDLPEGCNHKIGMGKPLGLGSIKITCSLHLSKRETRYNEIFSEWTDSLPESDNVKEFKNKFADYVLKQLNKDVSVKYTAENLWAEERMRELRRMLTFNHGIDEDKISYMTIKNGNDFRTRRVLPKPTDV